MHRVPCYSDSGSVEICARSGVPLSDVALHTALSVTFGAAVLRFQVVQLRDVVVGAAVLRYDRPAVVRYIAYHRLSAISVCFGINECAYVVR